ncbi:unnamed protein product, partial [Penicillium egyptiacum]
ARRGSEGLRTDTSWSSQLGGFLVRKEQLLPFDEKQQPAQAHPPPLHLGLVTVGNENDSAVDERAFAVLAAVTLAANRRSHAAH